MVDDKPLLPADKNAVKEITRRLESGESINDIIKEKKIDESNAEAKKEPSLDKTVMDLLKVMSISSVKNIILSKMMFLAPAGIFGTISYANLTDEIGKNDYLGYLMAAASTIFAAYAVYGTVNGYKELKKLK